MDVSADDSVGAALLGRMGDHVLEAGDELDGVLHLLLEVRRQRPIRQAALAPDPVEHPVELQQQDVCAVAKEGEPFGIEHDAVELVAVDHQQCPAVGGLVDRLVGKFDAAEIEPDIIAERFVMVARHIDDARPVLGFLENAAHHVVMTRRPVPALAQLPAVDDVADQIEGLAIDRFQEIEQQLGIAAGGAEVGVGDPHGAHCEQRAVPLEMVRLLDPRRRYPQPGHVPMLWASLPALAPPGCLTWRQLPGRRLAAPVRLHFHSALPPNSQSLSLAGRAGS
jgi:hypothetical protein